MHRGACCSYCTKPWVARLSEPMVSEDTTDEAIEGVSRNNEPVRERRKNTGVHKNPSSLCRPRKALMSVNQ
eukprot:scaffold272520_cov23-Tisochrysis_lutea.AAC.2